MSIYLNFRKPPYIIQDQCTSWSGKYHCFYGYHYHKGLLCYVVGSSSATTGEIITRHYNEEQKGTLSQEQAKAHAMACWHEFKQGMLRRPEEEEGNERSRELEYWFERADELLRSRKPK